MKKISIHHHPKSGGGGGDLLGNFFGAEKNFQIFRGQKSIFPMKKLFFTVVSEGRGDCLEVFCGVETFSFGGESIHSLKKLFLQDL